MLFPSPLSSKFHRFCAFFSELFLNFCLTSAPVMRIIIFAGSREPQTTLPNCVRVARQTLTLFVRVRILLRQPEQTAENARSRRFFLFFGPPPSPAGASARAVTEITGANLPRLPCPARLPRTNAPLVRYGTALPPRGAAQDAKTAERRLRRSVSIHQSSSSMSR